MKVGFMASRSTTYYGFNSLILIVRQLQEKYLAKKKDLWLALLDLEIAFDQLLK